MGSGLVKEIFLEPKRKQVLTGLFEDFILLMSLFIDPNPGDLTVARMKLG